MKHLRPQGLTEYGFGGSTAAPVAAVPQLLTEEEVAQHLGVTPRALQSWRTRGGGPRYVRLGRLVRYAPQEVSTWITEQTHHHTAEESI